MAKERKEEPELTDEELAFELLEVTCEEINSLAKAFEMISDLCRELNGEEVDQDEAEEPPAQSAIH